jgi:hypothetical protein
MKKCVELSRMAGLRNVSYAGMTDIPGRKGILLKEVEGAYERAGAKLAASYALSKGCTTHPRNCGACPSMSECPLKKYIPMRSC